MMTWCCSHNVVRRANSSPTSTASSSVSSSQARQLSRWLAVISAQHWMQGRQEQQAAVTVSAASSKSSSSSSKRVMVCELHPAEGLSKLFCHVL